jgi:hypothetical protein
MPPKKEAKEKQVKGDEGELFSLEPVSDEKTPPADSLAEEVRAHRYLVMKTVLASCRRLTYS